MAGSVTRLGFLKGLATNFLAKVAQIFGNFWCFFEKDTFLNQTTLATWGVGDFGENLATFDLYIWSHWCQDTYNRSFTFPPLISPTKNTF